MRREYPCFVVGARYKHVKDTRHRDRDVIPRRFHVKPGHVDPLRIGGLTAAHCIPKADTL